MSLRLGDTAPDFEQVSHVGLIQFYAWLGDSWGVLFSHAVDFTPVCTNELRVTAQLASEFDKRNVKMIALSVDSVESHQKWVNAINEMQDTAVSFPILADEDYKVSTLYDLIHPNENLNLAVRSLFVIDPKKIVRLIITYPLSTERNFDEVLRVIDSLQYIDSQLMTAATENTDQEFVAVSKRQEETKQASAGAYSHDSSIGYENKNWMGKVDGRTKLLEMSIPGTHNSAAVWGTLGPLQLGNLLAHNVICQSMSIDQQLNSGIRAFDIRLFYRPDHSLVLHHGEFYLNTSFKQVLDIMNSFLHENPLETVLMSVKEEYAGGSADFYGKNFEQAFDVHYQNTKNLFWRTIDEDPTLDEVRGKIVVLQNFVAIKKYGLPRRNTGFFEVQDDWHLNTNWDLYSKWEKVKHHMDSSARKKKKHIVFLSGSVGSFPYFVASGKSSSETNAPRLLTGLTTTLHLYSYPDFPRVSCTWVYWPYSHYACSIAFEGTNQLFTDKVNNFRRNRLAEKDSGVTLQKSAQMLEKWLMSPGINGDTVGMPHWWVEEVEQAHQLNIALWPQTQIKSQISRLTDIFKARKTELETKLADLRPTNPRIDEVQQRLVKLTTQITLLSSDFYSFVINARDEWTSEQMALAKQTRDQAVAFEQEEFAYPELRVPIFMYVGMVFADFPGKTLIETVINQNFDRY